MDTPGLSQPFLVRENEATLLFIEIDPVAKARPRFSRRSGHAYTPAKTRNYEHALRASALSQFRAQRRDLYTGPLFVRIDFQILRGKTVKRSYPSVKPDLDNLAKAVKDALNGVVWKDDGQIIYQVHTKTYGSNASVSVYVCPIDDQALN